MRTTYIKEYVEPGHLPSEQEQMAELGLHEAQEARRQRIEKKFSIEKIKQAVTGKTKEEREYEREFKKDIARAKRKAYMEAQKIQGIKIANRKAEIEANARIRKIEQQYAPRKQTSYGSFQSPFGGGSILGAMGGGGVVRRPQTSFKRFNPMTGQFTQVGGIRPHLKTKRKPRRRKAKFKMVRVRI